MTTLNPLDVKVSKAKKMMLWFGMISITMTFAGLTSAFIVSSSRPDWLDSFVLPNWFTISTVSIVFSSIFFQLAKFRLDEKLNLEFKIEKTIKNLEENYSVRDKQDLLAMSCIQFAAKRLQNKSKSNDSDIELEKMVLKMINNIDNSI